MLAILSASYHPASTSCIRPLPRTSCFSSWSHERTPQRPQRRIPAYSLPNISIDVRHNAVLPYCMCSVFCDVSAGEHSTFGDGIVMTWGYYSQYA